MNVAIHNYEVEALQFIQQTVSAAPDRLEWDKGKVSRFSTKVGKKDDSGWYVAHSQPIPVIVFGCWRQGVESLWRHDSYKTLSKADKAKIDQQVKQVRKEQKEAEPQRHEEAKHRANEIFMRSFPEDGMPHEYLTRKNGITVSDLALLSPFGAGVSTEEEEYKGWLVVPVVSKGEIQSLQFISDEDKFFLTGGKARGGYFPMGGEISKPLLICEGIATGVTIKQAMREYEVWCAFYAGNLEAVTKEAKEKYPNRWIFILADHDKAGVDNAKKAAQEGRVGIVVPEFGDKSGTDFNDLEKAMGMEIVRKQIKSGLSLVETANEKEDKKKKERLFGFTWDKFLESSKNPTRPIEIGLYKNNKHTKEPEPFLIPGAGITIIGARTGHGKSTVLLNCLARILEKTEEKRRVLYYTLEEPAEDVIKKLILSIGSTDKDPISENPLYQVDAFLETGALNEKYIPKVKSEDEKTSFLYDLEKGAKAVQSALEDKYLTIVSPRLGEFDTNIINEDLDTFKAEFKDEGEQPPIVMLDYAQNMATGGADDKGKVEELGQIMNQFIDMTKQKRFPLILAAQLKQGVHSANHLAENSIEWANSLAQGASCFIGVWNHNRPAQKDGGECKEIEHPDTAEIRVLKNRAGPQPRFLVESRLEHYYLKLEKPREVPQKPTQPVSTNQKHNGANQPQIKTQRGKAIS